MNNDLIYPAVALWLIFAWLMFSGCSAGIKIPEKQYIPTRCEIATTTPPSRKALNDSDYAGILEDAINIHSYSEFIEKDLNFCVKGEVNGK